MVLLALSAKDQRERDWLAFYRLAEQYRREHGDLLVPNDYVCQGKRLGAWIGTQRMEYKSRTNPRFTQARVDLLNAIGMVWDVRQFQWNRMYQALERYLQKHGTARVCHRGGGQAGNLAEQGSHGVQTGTLVSGATGPVRGPGRGLGAGSSAQGELGAFFCDAGGLCCL